MNSNKRIILFTFYILLGAVLFGCGATGLLDDFWSGMGGGLIAVGILQLIRHVRYRTNDDYREKFDTERQDERNKFISNKAWAWAGYLFVMIAGVSIFVFKFSGREELMMMAAWSVCLIIILYWISYLFLRRKY